MLLCKEFSCTYMYFFMTDLRIPQTWLLKMTHLLFHTSKCQKSKISITESKSRCSQSLTPFKAPRGKSISFFFLEIYFLTFFQILELHSLVHGLFLCLQNQWYSILLWCLITSLMSILSQSLFSSCKGTQDSPDLYCHLNILDLITPAKSLFTYKGPATQRFQRLDSDIFGGHYLAYQNMLRLLYFCN